MKQLVYVSSAVTLFSPEELATLLAKARANNQSLGVTGMLLYSGGNFVQVLEGDPPAVQQVMRKVSADRRHRGIIKLSERDVSAREFGDWSMGFRAPTQAEVRQLDGYRDVFSSERPPDVARVSAAEKILKTFLRVSGRL